MVRAYVLFYDNTDLFDCAVKLIEVDLSFIVNIEELEALGQESLLVR